MNLPIQLAKHLREVYFGGNWTASNLKDALADVTWQEATTQIHNVNTIATLVFHINYYLEGVTKKLQGGTLSIKDKYSFQHPPIQNEADWNAFLTKIWKDGETFAELIEVLPEYQLGEIFTEEKYGIYYRNLAGIVEHVHYHLGQIVVLKKILRKENNEIH